ncbi:Lysoplasmalogenase-like protein TMEM86A [Gossypium arboreum]|uniref:Lysoplasmalogenase-like protein TMEM86A n=1 Tax=Gossypium arboreum TaxID=29729 RepID=A0A0B0ND98_GOSAR|nr:Lysoplasmalogenase-like protein TMEM86A [Gossypium arboreum]
MSLRIMKFELIELWSEFMIYVTSELIELWSEFVIYVTHVLASWYVHRTHVNNMKYDELVVLVLYVLLVAEYIGICCGYLTACLRDGIGMYLKLVIINSRNDELKCHQASSDWRLSEIASHYQLSFWVLMNLTF